MRIAVTGSTGLIGSAVARRLRATHEVVTVGRRSISDVQVDLGDPGAVAQMRTGHLDALVHCAGVTDEDFRDDPEGALRMAVFGAAALVSSAVAAGATRLVYVSSAHSYGPLVGVVDEDTAVNPVSDYAIAHFATEQVFRRQVKDDVAAVVLRPCAVFGDLADVDRFRRWSLIPFSFPRDAVVHGAIALKSTGEQRRNFVGTEDIAGCCERWLNGEPSGWGVLNPVGELTTSVHEFAQMCASVAEELSGQPCTVSRVTPDGPTVGDDLDYTTRSPIARGTQDARSTVFRLMHALMQEK
jgi:UDP-glucose 4-epimerase